MRSGRTPGPGPSRKTALCRSQGLFLGGAIADWTAVTGENGAIGAYTTLTVAAVIRLVTCGFRSPN